MNRPVFHNHLPHFVEHEIDSLVPVGYGIDCSHDGGFYPYRIAEARSCVYMKDANGLDIRCESYEQAREHLAEVAD